MNDCLIHICRDSVFNDLIINHFEDLFPGKGRYILIDNLGEVSFHRPKKLEVLTRFQALKLLDDNRFFILHSLLNPSNIWFSAQFKSKHRVAWFSWGGDLPVENLQINYEPISYQEFVNQTGKINGKEYLYKMLSFLPFIHKWYYFFRTKEHHLKYLKEMGLKKIDIVSTVLPAERILLDKIKGFRAEYIWFNYGHLEYILGNFYSGEYSLGKGIYIGHSGFFENNHLDAFETISKSDLNMSIYCPLAYGDPNCVDVIMKKGTSLFGNAIEFQTNIVGLDEYHKLLIKNHVMILNTIQQQGVGNLLIGLYLGMKVFLNKKGMLYSYCKSINLIVCGLEDEFSLDNISEKLEYSKVEHNRKILKDIYSKENVCNRTKYLIHKLLEN